MTGIKREFAELLRQLRGNVVVSTEHQHTKLFVLHPGLWGISAVIRLPQYLCLLAALLLYGSAALAQSPSDPGSGALEEIIVTAQRRSENLEKTPVAVLVLTQDALASRAILSESDLQAAVPSLTVRATASSNDLNYAIRGQSVEAFTGSTPAVLPYINEVQINQHGASAFFDLQSVQVLEGPQGTLFGRNATGGAVLFTTVKPDNEFGGYVTARYGNYNTQQFEGAINVPLIDDKVLMRISGIYDGHNGYQFNDYTDSKVGGTYRSGGRFSLTVKPTDGFSNTLVAQFSDTGGFSKALVAYSGFAPNSPLAATAPIPGTLLYGPTLDAVFNFPGAWAAYLTAHPKVPAGGLYSYIASQNAQGPFVVNDNAPSPEHSQSIEVSNVTPPGFMQSLAIAVCILADKRATPVYPRWVGFANLWISIIYLPGGLAPFFHDGPFAWNGLVTFWMVAVAFFSYILMMWWMTVKAIKQTPGTESVVNEVSTRAAVVRQS